MCLYNAMKKKKRSHRCSYPVQTLCTPFTVCCWSNCKQRARQNNMGRCKLDCLHNLSFFLFFFYHRIITPTVLSWGTATTGRIIVHLGERPLPVLSAQVVQVRRQNKHTCLRAGMRSITVIIVILISYYSILIQDYLTFSFRHVFIVRCKNCSGENHRFDLFD